MTPCRGTRSVAAMKNPRFSDRLLIPLALTAVISLAVGHLTDLGVQMLGSGPTSTPALIGDLAGLSACALCVWVGMRRVPRSCT